MTPDFIRRHFGFEPTDDQAVLFERLSLFLNGEAEGDVMLVRGYAGTGKTSAISAFVKALKELGIKFRLMAPTGRSAKVLSNYTGEQAHTIHKEIYRQKDSSAWMGEFSLDFNKSHDTVFIVDEASLITIGSGVSPFGSGDLLSDLITYVRNNSDNRLILIGDDAQLPPVALDCSPALDEGYMSGFGPVLGVKLATVVRQAAESGILYNATKMRIAIAKEDSSSFPDIETASFSDVEMITGSELIEKLNDALDRYGAEETAVLCRSNRRANRYNAGIRSQILSREERLCRGDRVMIVKNCYQFVEGVPEMDFIANGDMAELVKIGHYEERYGLHFAQATLSFPDYGGVEIDAKVILDTLDSESASLPEDMQRALYEGVCADYADIPQKRKRNAAVREDKYYNALQLKYAHAITCHKAQGGQWRCVFIDNPFWNSEYAVEDMKWLYTAVTRAVEKLYFVNFRK